MLNFTLNNIDTYFNCAVLLYFPLALVNFLVACETLNYLCKYCKFTATTLGVQLINYVGSLVSLPVSTEIYMSDGEDDQQKQQHIR